MCISSCRALLEKHDADKASGRFDHGKPAAPGSAPMEVQAFMKEVREFMRDQKAQPASNMASSMAVQLPAVSYATELAAHTQENAQIRDLAEQESADASRAGDNSMLLRLSVQK